MKKLVLSVAVLLFVPALSFADSVGGCGWGSKLMDGQSGIVPQVLAVTTNGTSGNQTFGITTGTSGCNQNDTVRSSWRTAMYIDSNMNKIARDMSVGSGESLDSLASLMGMDEADKAVFVKVTKENFGTIFPKAGVTSGEVMVSLREVLSNNEMLAKYSHQI